MAFNIAPERIENVDQEEIQVRLGKAHARSSEKALHFINYAKPALLQDVPEKYDFWSKRKPIPIQDWGNNDNGDCTIASQGVLAEHMERLEQRKTIKIPTKNIVDTYYAMLQRVYGTTEDAGAYEVDALNNWRNPDYTFRDEKGRPLTIDAYATVDHTNIQQVKAALYTAGAKGIKICFALPWAWRKSITYWDIPEGQQPIGDYEPNSWGGHSTTAVAKYTKDGTIIKSTWQTQDIFCTWRALAIYADEAHIVIDSVNQWKKRLGTKFNISKLVSDVNNVSDVKIRA